METNVETNVCACGRQKFSKAAVCGRCKRAAARAVATPAPKSNAEALAAKIKRDGLPTVSKCMIDYLEKTLIPDLRESGSDYTASDFEECVGIMRAWLAKSR